MNADFKVIYNAITRKETPAYIPLYEHFVDDQVIEAIMGYEFSKIDISSKPGQLELWKKRLNFYGQMGYDYLPVEYAPRFAELHNLETADTALYSKGKRGWIDEHAGVIRSMDDLENEANWPGVGEAFDYGLFDEIAALLPEGMKIIGGASGGPFEHASFLVGLESLCIAIYEDEEFVARLFERIGNTLVGVAERLAKLDQVGAYRFGDDLGFKSGTMFSPAMLRKYVFPWQKRVVEVVHQAGKPFVLHSCGQLEAVMDDLIDDVKIDAKHSFEDVIMPVTIAKQKWGGRVALLGGIDVDLLCRRTPPEIKEHTKRTMDCCAQGGGYAIGSGNTIANYIPVYNYLAMLEAVREFNN
jgi:uroporphyrinogen decarboxylase